MHNSPLLKFYRGLIVLLFAAEKLQNFRKEGMWLVGADDFLILASSVKPCSAIALTLRWFPVARKKPIIYLLTLQKVCKQSPVARQKAYYGSNAVTESPKGWADRMVWPRGQLGWRAEVCMCKWYDASLRKCRAATQQPSKASGRTKRL